MAKKASRKVAARSTGTKAKSKTGSASRARSKAVTKRQSAGGSLSAKDGMGEAFIKLLQSPLAAELVAVAATSALAALAEHGFTSGEGARGKRAGKAVKEAGKAAAAAVGRRLTNELDEIRTAAKTSKGGAKA
jgi:hypothetical protein